MVTSVLLLPVALVSHIASACSISQEDALDMSVTEIYAEAEIVVEAFVVTATYDPDSGFGSVEVNIVRDFKGSVSGLARFEHDVGSCGLQFAADDRVYLFLDHDGNAKQPKWVTFMRHKLAPNDFQERLERLVGSGGNSAVVLQVPGLGGHTESGSTRRAGC